MVYLLGNSLHMLFHYNISDKMTNTSCRYSIYSFPYNLLHSLFHSDIYLSHYTMPHRHQHLNMVVLSDNWLHMLFHPVFHCYKKLHIVYRLNTVYLLGNSLHMSCHCNILDKMTNTLCHSNICSLFHMLPHRLHYLNMV